MSAANKTETPKATHNPATIPWPQDQQGAFLSLKRGGIEAARRVNGNADKLAKFEQVLRLLQQHARARYKLDTDKREASKENAKAAHQRFLDSRLRTMERSVIDLEKRLEAEANAYERAKAATGKSEGGDE